MKRALQQVLSNIDTCSACDYHSGAVHRYSGHAEPDILLVIGQSQITDFAENFSALSRYVRLLEENKKALRYGATHAVKCMQAHHTYQLHEAMTCTTHLEAELRVLRPSVILALGRDVAELLGLYCGPAWRGRWGTFQGFAVRTSWHPTFLVLNPVPRYTEQARADIAAVRSYIEERK